MLLTILASKIWYCFLCRIQTYNVPSTSIEFVFVKQKENLVSESNFSQKHNYVDAHLYVRMYVSQPPELLRKNDHGRSIRSIWTNTLNSKIANWWWRCPFLSYFSNLSLNHLPWHFSFKWIYLKNGLSNFNETW